MGQIRLHRQSLERYEMLMASAVQVQGRSLLHMSQSLRDRHHTSTHLQPTAKEGGPIAHCPLSHHAATSPSPWLLQRLQGPPFLPAFHPAQWGMREVASWPVYSSLVGSLAALQASPSIFGLKPFQNPCVIYPCAIPEQCASKNISPP